MTVLQKIFFIKNHQKAFSLIELMIVIAIIAILSGISVGNYSGNVRENIRSEASAQLLMIQANYEVYYQQNNSYPASNTLPPSASIPSTAHYTYSSTVTSTGYTITATATGNQTADTGCTTLSLSNLGVNTPANCWPQ